MQIQVQLNDTPGSLARLLSLITKQKANILHISHDRNITDIPLFVTSVSMELETRGNAHITSVFNEIRQAGYLISKGNGPVDLPPVSNII